jgi:hypothetical protein
MDWLSKLPFFPAGTVYDFKNVSDRCFTRGFDLNPGLVFAQRGSAGRNWRWPSVLIRRQVALRIHLRHAMRRIFAA